MISCGLYHSLCIDFDGNIFSFGFNKFGQLGIGKDKNEVEYTHIPQKLNLPPIIQISCGSEFSICLSYDKDLYSFGDNYFGQLGIGITDELDDDDIAISPQCIPNLNNIELVECGAFHVICKNNSNICYSWGSNERGQLGQGNNDDFDKPIQCLNWPDNIISIKSGVDYSILLTLEGQVFSFGNNFDGQLGINETTEFNNSPILIKDLPFIQKISCGYNHTLCIDIDNNIWLFGGNYHGQLGLGDKEKRIKPLIHPTLKNIIDVSSDGNMTYIKTIDNKIYVFGNNKCSQLGINTSEEKQPHNEQLTPIQIFQDNEDIWCSTLGKSKQKSARK